MPTARQLLGALLLGCTALSTQACGGSGDGSGSGSGGELEGTYASVNDDNLTMAFKSGGVVEMAAVGMGSSAGTYTVDGDKITVTIDNATHTFIKDGDCVEEGRNIFGKLCKGGKTGAAATAGGNAMEAASGTWTASNSDGEFKLTFVDMNRVKLEMTPAGGTASSQDGTFVVESPKVFVTLSTGTAMVLTHVNNSFESNAFGIPMKFVKQ